MIRKCFIAIAILWFLAASVLINGNALWADAQGKGRKDEMVLEKREGDCIVVHNRCYRISETTSIKDHSGETLSLTNLSLPCFARVNYYYNPKENVFEVISIEVLGDP